MPAAWAQLVLPLAVAGPAATAGGCPVGVVPPAAAAAAAAGLATGFVPGATPAGAVGLF